MQTLTAVCSIDKFFVKKWTTNDVFKSVKVTRISLSCIYRVWFWFEVRFRVKHLLWVVATIDAVCTNFLYKECMLNTVSVKVSLIQKFSWNWTEKKTPMFKLLCCSLLHREQSSWNVSVFILFNFKRIVRSGIPWWIPPLLASKEFH